MTRAHLQLCICRTKLIGYSVNTSGCLEDDAGNVYAVIRCNQMVSGAAAVEPTPPGHAPANIIGLKLLLKLGLDLDPDKNEHSSNFIFKRMPVAF